MVSYPEAALAVECCILAAYLVFTIFASIVYFGRRSYKCVLRPFAKSQMMSRSQASRKLAAEVTQRWWLDLLVTSILVVILLRTFAEFVRVLTYARQLELGVTGTPVLERISTAVLLISVTSYSFVFCTLIWMWLRLFLSLFDESKSKRNCILWTVRVTTIGCILSAVITAVGLSIIFGIPDALTKALYPSLGVIVFCIILYFVSLAALCTVVFILGIRIIVLIKRTTAASSPTSEKDRLMAKSRRTALTKISVAVAAFVLALVIRTLGIGLMMLSMYIPSWIASLMLLSMPEFVTFGTLIVILWPFKVKCCNRFDTLEEEEEEEVEAEMKKEPKVMVPKLALESVTAGTESSPNITPGSSIQMVSPGETMAASAL